MKSERNLTHYVKLHFVRPVHFKNSDKLDILENEYFSLEFSKKSLSVFPTLLILFSTMFLWLSPIFILFLVAGGCWFYFSYKKIKKKLDAQNKKIEVKETEILKKVELLTEE